MKRRENRTGIGDSADGPRPSRRQSGHGSRDHRGLETDSDNGRRS
jgi:hypothetical protein